MAIRKPRTASPVRAIAWLLWVAATTLMVVNAYYFWLNLSAGVHLPERWAFPGTQVLTVAATATPGLLIALRRATNPVGWLMLGIAILLAVEGLLTEYAINAAILQRQTTGFAAIAAWGASGVFIFYFSVLIVPALLLFPTGKLLSRRWRAVVGLGLGAALLLFAGRAFTSGPLPEFSAFQNPFGVMGAGTLTAFVESTGFVLFALVFALAVLSVILRFRRSRGVERQQMKWFAFAGSLAVLSFAVMVFSLLLGVKESNLALHKALEAAVEISFVGIMLSIFIAILRHRLLDIDLVINRTMVYIPLTGLLGGLYIGGIQFARLIFTELTGATSDAVIILTVLIIASLFTPLRSSLQGFVDRTFKELHDPIRELGKFDRDIRAVIQVLDARSVTKRLLDECFRVYQVQAGAVRLHRHGVEETIHSTGDDAPAFTIPIVCDGQTLGELALGPRADGRPYSDADKAAIQECAADVGRAVILSRGPAA